MATEERFPVIPVLVQELRISKGQVLKMDFKDAIDTYSIFIVKYINEHRLVKEMRRKSRVR